MSDDETDWIRERYSDWRESREWDPSETLQQRTTAQYWRSVAEAADTEPPTSFYDHNPNDGDALERQYDTTQAALLNDYLWSGDGS